MEFVRPLSLSTLSTYGLLTIVVWWFEVVFWIVLRHDLEYKKNSISFETL